MFTSLDSDRLSWFRTEHRFLNYTEIECHENYAKAIANRGATSSVCMLGNGSNCLFARKKVKTFLLKNKLPKETRWTGEGELWASSSVPLMSVLKQCKQKSLDSFYYLSSVPATVGGAIAMNAGRGRQHNKTIFDFIQEVEFWTPDGKRSLLKDEIKTDYRYTTFLDHPDWFISGAKFKFPSDIQLNNEDPVAGRVAYSQEVQDHSGPNCGSVFKIFQGGILNRFRGIGLMGATFSSKTLNWIVNRSKSPRGVLSLIRLAQLVHFIRGKKCRLEIRIIK